MIDPAAGDIRELWKQEFLLLLEELGLQRFAYSMQLHDILKEMSASRELDSSDLEGLEIQQKYPVLAVYCEQRFRADSWEGHLNEASKWWRKADQPKEALRRAEISIASTNKRIKAFGYTTGAAALLDLGEMVMAEDWAAQAIVLEPLDPHPFRVFGQASAA